MSLNYNTGNTTQLKEMMDILRDAGEIRLKPGQPVIIRTKGKPRESAVKDVFRPQSLPPATKIKRIRKTSKHLRNIQTSELQNEDCQESQDDAIKHQSIRTEICTGDSTKETKDSKDLFENRIIETSDFRRFAQEKLPSSSILREVLKEENDELTVEEFLAKMDIWCLLFRKDIGE